MNAPSSSSIEPLEARIAPAGVANLALHFISMDFPKDVAVPGDSGTITFTIENVGDAPATKNTCVNIWLVSEPGAGKTPGDLVYDSNLVNSSRAQKIVDGLEDVPLNLAPGKTSGPITKKFTLPGMVLPDGFITPGALIYGYGGGVHPFNMQPGPHYIVAEVDGASENEPPFFFNALYHKNNFASAPAPFDYQYRFGKVGTRDNVQLDILTGTFNGTVYTGPTADFFMKGGGTGEITPVNGGLYDIKFTGTAPTSAAGVLIKTTKVNGVVSTDQLPAVRDITAANGMQKISFPTLQVVGDVKVLGGLEGLKLGNIGGVGKQIFIGGTVGTDKPTKIQLGRVNDLDLNAAAGIDTLEVVDWTNPNVDPDVIDAAFINKLLSNGNGTAQVPGDFAANVKLSGANAGFALTKAIISGTLHDAQWTITGAANKVGDLAMSDATKWIFTADGSVKQILVINNLQGTQAKTILTANSFENILVGDTISAKIVANGANDKDAAIGKLVATSLFGTSVVANGGGIQQIDVGEWIGGTLESQWVRMLSVDGKGGTGTPGDFSAAVTLTGRNAVGAISLAPTNVKGAITNATIAGSLSDSGIADDWSVADGIVSLKVGGLIGETWKLNGAAGAAPLPTDIGMLQVKGMLKGAIVAHSINTLTVGDDFTGSINLSTGTDDLALKKAKLERIAGGTIQTVGTLLNLDASNITGATISGSRIGTIASRGNPSQSIKGDIASSTITSQGVILGIKAADRMENVSITGGTLVLSLVSDAWVNGSLTAKEIGTMDIDGTLEKVNIALSGQPVVSFGGIIMVGGFVNNSKITTNEAGLRLQFGGMISSTVTAGASLKIFEIRGGKVTGALFSDSDVNAPKIDTVILREVNTTGTSAADFGITTGFIGHYSRSVAGKVVVRETKLDDPQTFEDIGDFKVNIT